MTIEQEHDHDRATRLAYGEIDVRSFYVEQGEWRHLEDVPSFADWVMVCGWSGFKPETEEAEKELIRFAQASLILHEGPGRWPWKANTREALYEFAKMHTLPVQTGPVAALWGAYQDWLTSAIVPLTGVSYPRDKEWARSVVAEFKIKRPLLMKLYHMRR